MPTPAEPARPRAVYLEDNDECIHTPTLPGRGCAVQTEPAFLSFAIYGGDATGPGDNCPDGCGADQPAHCWNTSEWKEPAPTPAPAPTLPRCDMERDCTASVTHLDHKGYVYCTAHGEQRKRGGIRCRPLKPAEILLLEQGKPVSRY